MLRRVAVRLLTDIFFLWLLVANVRLYTPTLPPPGRVPPDVLALVLRGLNVLVGRFSRNHKISLLLICVLLAACAGAKPDRSLLEGTPCPAPCWQGIDPGSASEPTVSSVLINPELVEQDTITRINNAADRSVTVYNFRLMAGGSGTIGLRNGIVTRIVIRPDYSLRLQELIDAFGAPDWVYVKNQSSEFQCYNVDVFFVQKGVWVDTGACLTRDTDMETEYIVRSDNTANVYSEMEVSNLTFFEPGGNLKSTLESMGYSPDYVNGRRNHAAPWTDYGFYPMVP